MRFGNIGRLVGALAFILAAAQAQAAIVTQHFSGVVEFAAAGSGFDLGDPMNGNAVFDAGLLSGSGLESLTPETDPALRLTVNFGEFDFHEDDDADFPRFPRLDFIDGRLDDLNFKIISEFFVFFAGDGRSFEFRRGDDIVASGHFTFDTIPEPATATLLTFGLAGIVSLRRRRA